MWDSNIPSSMYSWSTSHILKHEFFFFGLFWQLVWKKKLSISEHLLRIFFSIFVGKKNLKSFKRYCKDRSETNVNLTPLLLMKISDRSLVSAQRVAQREGKQNSKIWGKIGYHSHSNSECNTETVYRTGIVYVSNLVHVIFPDGRSVISSVIH